jgi:putative phosphoserine phosphatase/1-acylglycerol-3-phosphate O-acyltransferase
MNASLAAALDAIAQSPKGPRIGAFFDYDGTLIDGYSAAAYFTDRLRRGEMGVGELVDTVRMARKGDLSDAEFNDIIGKGILDWAGLTEDEMRRCGTARSRPRPATLFPRAGSWCGRTRSAATRRHRVLGDALPDRAVGRGVRHRASFAPGRGCATALTGGLVGTPMWGKGKAAGVVAFAREQGIDLGASFGYANGNEDIDFLKSVGHATAVQPKEMLAQVAGEAGWPILRFPRRHRGPPEAMARTVGAYGAMATTFLAGLGYATATGRTRRAVDFITSVASDAALATVGVDVEVIGEEHLWSSRPCVFIINHQSKIDMFLMMYLIRRGFTGVAKKEAQNTPGFGTFMKMADMAFIDRHHTGKAIDALQPAVDRLKQGCAATPRARPGRPGRAVQEGRLPHGAGACRASGAETVRQRFVDTRNWPAGRRRCAPSFSWPAASPSSAPGPWGNDGGRSPRVPRPSSGRGAPRLPSRSTGSTATTPT